ncbi:MAG: hypothetical protein ACOY94_13040 [Bacillota bacterium]
MGKRWQRYGIALLVGVIAIGGWLVIFRVVLPRLAQAPVNVAEWLMANENTDLSGNPIDPSTLLVGALPKAIWGETEIELLSLKSTVVVTQITLALSDQLRLTDRPYLEDESGNRSVSRNSPSVLKGPYEHAILDFSPPIRPGARQVTLVLPADPPVHLAVPLVQAGDLATERFGPEAIAGGIRLRARVLPTPAESLVTVFVAGGERAWRPRGIGQGEQRAHLTTPEGLSLPLDYGTDLRAAPRNTLGGDLFGLTGGPLPAGARRVGLTIPALMLEQADETRIPVPVPPMHSGQDLDLPIRFAGVDLRLTRVEAGRNGTAPFPWLEDRLRLRLEHPAGASRRLIGVKWVGLEGGAQDLAPGGHDGDVVWVAVDYPRRKKEVLLHLRGALLEVDGPWRFDLSIPSSAPPERP